MIGHEAVGPDIDAGLVGLAAENLDISLVVAVAEERPLTAEAALGDVVGMTGRHDPRATWHVQDFRRSFSSPVVAVGAHRRPNGSSQFAASECEIG